MATLCINEYAQMAADRVNSPVPAPQEPALRKQAVDIGPDMKLSEPFHPHTRFIRIATDAPCSIDIGENPQAVAGLDRIAGNSESYRGVEPKHRLAAIETE